MKGFIRTTALVVVVSSGVASIATAHTAASSAAAIDGRWNASLTHENTLIPFRLDISGSGPTLKGTLYDGFEPYDGTTSATFHDGKLVLNIEHYLTTITATLTGGELIGTVAIQSRAQSTAYSFKATRYVLPAAPAADAPTIAGSWEIPLDTPSSKGEKAFRFIVEQNGADVAASILRVDGDTGAYTGTYKDGKWVLSHFDGSRPGVIEVSLTSDGTLEILQNGGRGRTPAAQGAGSTQTTASAATASGNQYGEQPGGSRYASKLVAYREEVAKAKGLP